MKGVSWIIWSIWKCEGLEVENLLTRSAPLLGLQLAPSPFFPSWGDERGGWRYLNLQWALGEEGVSYWKWK